MQTFEKDPDVIDAIPEPISRFLIDKANELAERDITSVEQLDSVTKIPHADGTCTYAATDEKTYVSNGSTEKLIYVANTDAEGDFVGYGEVRFAPDSTDQYFTSKPFVGITRTFDGYKGMGYGRKRILEMGELSMSFFGLPLHSDTVITTNAERIWQGLVQEGLAVQYQEGEHPRYSLN